MDTEFDDLTQKEIKFYVYALKDPRNGEIFYIGKGVGNRVFQHVQDALKIEDKSDKLDKIREIIAVGYSVEHFLIRHGLSEDMAYEVEATLIDLLDKDKKLKFNITNIVQGSHTYDRGIIGTTEANALYGGKKIDIIDPVILININKLFKRNMTKEELYEATRKSWALGKNREKAQYALVHYKGIIREVYKITNWYPVHGKIKTRRAFNGFIAKNDIRNKYIYGLVKSKKGAAFPIRYINCG